MKISGDLAELLGIHVGDGCISCNGRYDEYALSGDLTEEREYYDSWILPLFNKVISIPLLGRAIKAKEYPSIGTYGFFIFDKRIVKFYNKLGIKTGPKTNNIHIPSGIFKNKKLIKRFLRGLFDTDGCIYFEKNRATKSLRHYRSSIKLDTTSKDLAKQVMRLLFGLGYHPRLKKPYKGKRDKNFVYTILIYRVNDVKRWMEKDIGLKSTKHLTKWLIYKKFGHCPPYTTLAERKRLLKQKTL